MCGVFQACLLVSITCYRKTDPVQRPHCASTEIKVQSVNDCSQPAVGGAGPELGPAAPYHSGAVSTLTLCQLMHVGTCLMEKTVINEKISYKLIVGISNLNYWNKKLGKSDETEAIPHSST